MRYFDGRTFESLLTVLHPKQKASFLSTATSWSYVNRAGNNLSEVGEYWPMDEGLPLILDDEQESLLLELSEPDQVAMLVQAVLPPDFVAKSPQLRFDFIKRNIQLARDFGVDAIHELALYCCLAAEDEEFYQSKRWQGKIEDLKMGKTTLTAALASLSE